MKATHKPEHVVVLLLTAVCSLALTFAAWFSARGDAEAEARRQFEVQVAEIVGAIRSRAADYEQVLRGAAGLFAASESVERSEWDAYVDALRIATVYPGLRAVGYAPYVHRAEREALERQARVDGVPGYAIEPPGEREAYVPVLYIRPRVEGTRIRLGQDLYLQPERRQALEHARDTGTAAITRALMIADTPEGSPIPGSLMYLPVYRNGAPAGTVAERRAALAGFVFVPFRYVHLAAGIFGMSPGLNVRMADIGDGAAAVELVSDTAAAQFNPHPRFARSVKFPVAQRVWRLDATSLPALEAEVSGDQPRLILASGLAISALLMLVVWTLATTRARARELAELMTVALRASEERLQLALGSSHLALFDWDVNSGIVQLSAEWSAMLGGAAEPTLSHIQKLQLLDHADDQAEVRAKVRAMLDGETEGCRYEHRVRRLDGRWLWVETVARVNERDADRRPLRVTGANSNIEERKAVERMKAEFVATVNHELRTPLTSMLGSLGLVREGSAGELPDEAKKFVEIAYANSERLAELVNDILDIERIEAGRMEMHVASVDTAALLQRAVELNAAYAERLGVRLALAEGMPAAPVRADADRLMQALTNLLSNAAKYSPRGEVVTLAAADAGRMLRISVADRGPGIPEEFRARLFGKFEQADRQRGGTGLGLAISKALVERMEGRIGCDSAPGQGTTFWLELPKA